jgi:Zn-dependent protease
LENRLVELTIFLPLFLLSISVHEAAHAITARWGGDLTADRLGRVTLNPLPHIDWLGTILLPVVLILSGIPFFLGWAKPVPVVTSNLRRGSSFSVVIALAGPVSNLMIAFAATILLMLVGLGIFVMAGVLSTETIQSMEAAMTFAIDMIVGLITMNLGLAAFNMLPVPPLDGHYLLYHWWAEGHPAREAFMDSIRPFAFIILLVLVNVGALAPYFKYAVKVPAEIMVNHALSISEIKESAE